MKILKLAALAAITAAAFASVVTTASATTINNSEGTILGSGTTIVSEAEGTTILHPPIGDIECSASKVEGKTSNEGSATETVKGGIETLTFAGCNATVTVLKKGELEIHTKTEDPDNNGTLTSTGAEVTVEFKGFHCIFSTNATDIGTLTGSKTTGGNATLDIEATIPRTGGRSGAFCGSPAQWTGSYKVTNPSTLNVDGSSGALTPSKAGVKGAHLTYTVGVKEKIEWTNNTDSNLVLNVQSVHNVLIVETSGGTCENIASTKVCSEREIKCLKEGLTSITMISGKVVMGIATITCDKK